VRDHDSDVPRRRIGVVSTRIGGTDGVSLEIMKWARVLRSMGHALYYFTGECDQPGEVSLVVPEAHFQHPEILGISRVAYTSVTRPPEVTRRIHDLQSFLKQHLYEFRRRFDLELLIVENALSIPLNIPLGLALTEFIAETGMPVIAHHHDFSWERKRFVVNCVGDYLEMAFPPVLPNIQHVVINSLAALEVGRRRGINVTIIPNVMDFDREPAPPDGYTAALRADLGVGPDEYFFLQPTRAVQRKGIEHAVELLRRLEVKARLVISHSTDDEGGGYKEHIRTFAGLLGVPVNFVSDQIAARRGTTADGQRIYALGDVYPHADMVTYPSLLEGFGNAFLEAIYYRRPLVVNNYTIYATDLKPLGFRVIEFDGYITDETVAEARRVLNSQELVEEMAEHNYNLARKNFSYELLERQLPMVIESCFGLEK